jgi:hypothetical protein
MILNKRHRIRNGPCRTRVGVSAPPSRIGDFWDGKAGWGSSVSCAPGYLRRTFVWCADPSCYRRSGRAPRGRWTTKGIVRRRGRATRARRRKHERRARGRRPAPRWSLHANSEAEASGIMRKGSSMTEPGRSAGGDGGGRRRKRFLSPSQKYEIWVGLLRGELSTRQAADRVGVDRSTIRRVREVAKQGALDALASSRPGVTCW